jgi:hypothetical protein
MRKLITSAILGLGALGINADANQAKASWLSDVVNHSQIQVSIGSQYPAYPAPVYAPTPAYQVYQPAPAYPAPNYYPVPAVPVPVYRPVPVYVPQRPNVGHYQDHHWHDGRNDYNWRR